MGQLFDYLTEKRIFLDIQVTDKDELLSKAVDLIEETSNGVTNPIVFKSALKYREDIVSTGIGDGAAITHCKTDGINELDAAFIRLKQPIEYDAVDGKPVDLVFIIGIPPTENEEYMRLLPGLSYALRDGKFLQGLREADSVHTVAELISAKTKNKT